MDVPNNNLPQKPLITIVGPTASGKTDLAIELAKKFNGEILNADSRQICKKINIASAKPRFTIRGSRYTIQGVPHHLFDIVNPDEIFNVTHFQKRAQSAIKDVHARGRLPFLVGGTGLWVSAVVDHYKFPKIATQSDTRRTRQTNEQLFHELIARDPGVTLFINPKNRRRIIRALDVIEATKKPFSQQREKGPQQYAVLQLGVRRSMQELERRIHRRLNEQIKEGLVEEARELINRYDPALPALSSIGTREWKAYFEKSQSYDETIRLIKLHNRQYAKRQMTWFKRDASIHWIQNKNEAERLITSFIKSFSAGKESE